MRPSSEPAAIPPQAITAETEALEPLAIAAYEAFSLSSACGELPPWEGLPPDTWADWRAVAKAVREAAVPHMLHIHAEHDARVAAVERERCAQLARKTDARYCESCYVDMQSGAPSPGDYHEGASFADLLFEALREQP